MIRMDPAMKTFGQEVVDFYGLDLGQAVKFYFLGLSVYPQSDNYEAELDRLMEGIREELGEESELEKIGLTLSPDIAEQRPDIATLVGDFAQFEYDGILFVPRPARWVNGSPQGLTVFELFGYLLPRTDLGVIAFNLDKDYSRPEIQKLGDYLASQPTYTAEIVHSPEWPSHEHILARPTIH